MQRQKGPPGQGSSADQHPMVVAVVRWFKYIVPMYVEEISQNLREWVATQVTFLYNDSPEFMQRSAQQGHQEALNLQKLYGHNVLPADLLQCVTGSLPSLTVLVLEGSEEVRCIKALSCTISVSEVSLIDGAFCKVFFHFWLVARTTCNKNTGQLWPWPCADIHFEAELHKWKYDSRAASKAQKFLGEELLSISAQRLDPCQRANALQRSSAVCTKHCWPSAKNQSSPGFGFLPQQWMRCCAWLWWSCQCADLRKWAVPLANPLSAV